MTKDQTIKEINYYCHKLGHISNLVFIRHNGQNLDAILDELKYFYNICIIDSKK